MQAYERLEHELAEWCGREHVVVCNSGTAALHLALETLAHRPWRNVEKVLIPDYTFVACPRAVTLAGLTPVFVDCGDDLNADADLLFDYGIDPTNNAHGHLAAVMAVHVYGRQCDMYSVTSFATDYGSLVIEDMAEAHGLPIHTFTEAACYSFYRNKIVCGEEGGAVAFKTKEHADRARLLRSLGYAGGGGWQHLPRGMNYRMTNAQAELISTSLGRVHDELMRRKDSEAWYDLLLPKEFHQPPRDVPWVYDLRVRGMAHAQQAKLVKGLQTRGIAARDGFRPMSHQEEYHHCRVVGEGNAAVASREVICLPLPATKEEVAVAVDTVLRFTDREKLPT